MSTPHGLGLLYFLVVFGFAFATGMTRELFIAPRLGSVTAVFLEIPILVLVSWIVARRLVGKRPFVLYERAMMGATGFALTMASEAALAMLLRGQTLTEWAATVFSPLGLAGLCSQIAFAIMPILVGRTRTQSPHSENGIQL
jgi:hypothetical protein